MLTNLGAPRADITEALHDMREATLELRRVLLRAGLVKADHLARDLSWTIGHSAELWFTVEDNCGEVPKGDAKQVRPAPTKPANPSTSPW